MVEYAVFDAIEQTGPHQFVARVIATRADRPYGAPHLILTSAPCVTRAEAQRQAQRLIGEMRERLAHEARSDPSHDGA